jgi:hypothetical protein
MVLFGYWLDHAASNRVIGDVFHYYSDIALHKPGWWCVALLKPAGSAFLQALFSNS